MEKCEDGSYVLSKHSKPASMDHRSMKPISNDYSQCSLYEGAAVNPISISRPNHKSRSSWSRTSMCASRVRVEYLGSNHVGVGRLVRGHLFVGWALLPALISQNQRDGQECPSYKNWSFSLVCFIAFLLLNLAGTSLFADEKRVAESSNLEKSVVGLFARRCAECHYGESTKGGFSLANRESLLKGGDSGPALVPSKPLESLIWQKVSSDEMPPKRPLPQQEKDLLKQWIENGAEWSHEILDPDSVSTDHRAGRDWWSFQPLTRPRLDFSFEQISNDVLRSPIDGFVAEKRREHQLRSSTEADR
ncbi:MAG: hypothetical protein FJ267_14160, partial [Planctomycetes bacterium]|nr:hypothetical protein [Planctomycetota bacterium]